MPRTKVNKAAKIRETFEALGPEARPKDVIATLAAKKIKVSSAQVSNIRSGLNGHAKNGHAKRGRKKAGNGEMIALSDLQAAKKLVETLGSIEKAESALSALAKLQ
jgi:hypothetical protein